MEILIKRTDRSETFTIGELSINGKFQNYTGEDKDRGLKSSMSLDEINKIKVHGKTAIPTGRYQLIISFSNRFQKYLPELLNVPGFAGIRWHAGNFEVDTDGCQLQGMQKGDNKILDSKTAMTYLMKKLEAIEKKEKIWVTVE